MTAAVLEDVRALSDDDLAAMWDGEDETARAAVLAEAARRDQTEAAKRDRADRARRARDAERDGWELAAHAAYLAAVDATNGYLLSRAGIAAGIDEQSLWTGPADRAYRYASEELREHWRQHGRLTVTDWRHGLADSRRDERSADNDQPSRTGKPMIGTRIVERGVKQAARSQPRDWAATSAGIRQRIDDRQAARLSREQVQHPAVAVWDMAAAEPAASAAAAPRREREPVDGAQVLDYVRLYLERFAVWPSEAALDAAVLWIAHAHARDAGGRLVWQYSPRWLFLSADPGSGKSWMLRLMAKLTPHGKLLLEPTPAAVARAIGRQQATVFLDETDILFSGGAKNASIRSIVNSGYEPDGEWSRAAKGNDTSDIPVFGPMGLAGLDKLKTATGDALRAMLDRCIIVRVQRAPEGYRPPRFDDKARAIAAALSNALTAWAAQERDRLREAVPEVPEGLGNRAAALWEPLLAIGDAAGGRWPEAAREACAELVATEGLPADDMDELDEMLAGWVES